GRLMPSGNDTRGAERRARGNPVPKERLTALSGDARVRQRKGQGQGEQAADQERKAHDSTAGHRRARTSLPELPPAKVREQRAVAAQARCVSRGHAFLSAAAWRDDQQGTA